MSKMKTPQTKPAFYAAYSINSRLPVPTREQFHQSYAGCITKYDFYTSDCIPGLHVNKIASALKLDEQLKRNAILRQAEN